MLIKKVFDSSKNEIFLQVNDLYKVEEQSIRVNDNNFVGGKSEIQLFKGILEKGKE